MGTLSVAMVPFTVYFLVLCLSKCTLADETWFPGEASQQEVCYKAKGKRPGTINVPKDGFIQGIRLKHVRGGVNCAERHPEWMSKFGCNHPNLKGQIGSLITTEDNTVIFPVDIKWPARVENFFYSGGNAADSTIVTFYDDDNPWYFDAGSKLELWYGEDFTARQANGDSSADNNNIDNCVKVSFLYVAD